MAYTIVGLVVFSIGFMGVHIYNNFLESEEIRKRIATLPELNASPVLFSTPDTLTSQPIIINYFNTLCRFCQSEIQSISEHPNLTKQARILLISDEPKRRLQLYAESIDLDSTRIEVAWDSLGSIKELFGVRGVPATFVYSKDSLLIESFKGETKADILYELIK